MKNPNKPDEFIPTRPKALDMEMDDKGKKPVIPPEKEPSARVERMNAEKPQKSQIEESQE